MATEDLMIQGYQHPGMVLTKVTQNILSPVQ